MRALRSVLKSLADRVLAGRHWKTKALFIVLVLALLRAFPSYETLGTRFVQSTWQAAQLKADNPMLDTGPMFRPRSHNSKLTFRLTVPVVAHVLHLRRTGVLIGTAFVGILLLYTVLKIAESVTGDRGMAFLVCLAIACVWPGLAAFHDLRGGYYDAVALCLLLLSMAAEWPALAGICAFLAAWTDERALIALPLVLLFGATNARARVAAIAIAGAGYAVTRAALAFLYGWTTNTAGAGFGVFRHQASMIPLGIWTGLGGCWILVFASIYVLLRNKQFLTLALFALALALVLAAASMVFDLTRSAAYCLPAVFVALAILQRHRPPRLVSRLVFIAAALSLLLPTLYLEGKNVFRLHAVSRWSESHVIN